MTDRYASMSIDELLAEWEAWNYVIQSPKGPGTPSNSDRDVALRHQNEIGGWVARRRLEERT